LARPVTAAPEDSDADRTVKNGHGKCHKIPGIEYPRQPEVRQLQAASGYDCNGKPPQTRRFVRKLADLLDDELSQLLIRATQLRSELIGPTEFHSGS
jgi:hypothetical protein